jgi:hypothetical protein
LLYFSGNIFRIWLAGNAGKYGSQFLPYLALARCKNFNHRFCSLIMKIRGVSIEFI